MTATNGTPERGPLPATVAWTTPPAAPPTGPSNLSLTTALRLLRNRWWLLLLGLLPTVLLAYDRVTALPPTYQSVSSFVVRPVQGNAEQLVRAMDTLLRGVEINTTYANVVGSRVVTDRALERLDLADGRKPSGLDASGEVVTGTNIVEIHTTAQDPQLAHDFGEAVAAETVAFIDGLQNAFGLVELDPPTLPSSPVGPRVRLTVLLSAFLGGLLGLALVLVSGIVFPLGGTRRLDIVDPLTGAGTRDYLLLRARQELARVHRHGGMVSVALVDAVARQRGPSALLAWLVADRQLTRTATMLRRQLDETDVVAYVGRGRFAILAPERAGSAWLTTLRLPGSTSERPVPYRTFVGRPDQPAPPLPADLDELLRAVTAPAPVDTDPVGNGAVPQRLPTSVAGR